jgi:hypothetical protein
VGFLISNSGLFMRVYSLALRLGLMMLTIGVLPKAYAEAGKVRLTLVDAQTQRPVADAKVTVIPRNGAAQSVNAADDGRAESPALPAGLYEIQVSGPGYQTARLPSVRIVEDKTTSLRVDLVLQRQNVEEVLVVGTAIGADPLSSVGTSLVDREALNSAAGSGGDVLRVFQL